MMSDIDVQEYFEFLDTIKQEGVVFKKSKAISMLCDEFKSLPMDEAKRIVDDWKRKHK